MFGQEGDSAGLNWKFWLVLATALVTLLATLIWILRMTHMPLSIAPPGSSDEAASPVRCTIPWQYPRASVLCLRPPAEFALGSRAQRLVVAKTQALFTITRQTPRVLMRPVSSRY